MFEAGALAKRKTARVVPLCVDLPPTDVTGPLAAFQGRSLDEPGVRRLVYDLNQETEKPLDKDQLDEVLDREWPDLEADIAKALEREWRGHLLRSYGWWSVAYPRAHRGPLVILSHVSSVSCVHGIPARERPLPPRSHPSLRTERLALTSRPHVIRGEHLVRRAEAGSLKAHDPVSSP
jgi:hypothetical protein